MERRKTKRPEENEGQSFGILKKEAWGKMV